MNSETSIEKLIQTPLTKEEKAELKAMVPVFGQAIEVLKLVDLGKIAAKHDANKWCKRFDASSHLSVNIFSHFAGASSLRELENGIETFRGDLNKVGVKYAPSRSTLSYANANRPYEYFEEVFYTLLRTVENQCQHAIGGLKRRFKFKANLYSIDATVIDLTHSMFNWALYRATKGGVKLHLMLEHDTFCPVWAFITNAREHDQKVLETVDPVRGLPKGSFVVADRAYNDYAMLNLWNERKINFVCRAKDNMAYEVVKEIPVPNKVGRPLSPDKERPAESHVVRDVLVKLTGKRAKADYPGVLRAVTFWVEEDEGSRHNSREMTFFTNNMTLSPVTIAAIYKSRWHIEAFFRLIKQKLKIKSFLGTSPNAVKSQLFCALICILILRFLQAMCTTGWSVSHLLSLIRLTLFLHLNLRFYLNLARPNAPPKPGVPRPARPVARPRDRLF
jgi:hypothetical protein